MERKVLELSQACFGVGNLNAFIAKRGSTRYRSHVFIYTTEANRKGGRRSVRGTTKLKALSHNRFRGRVVTRENIASVCKIP